MFKKSSRCESHTCVEVADTKNGVYITDSKIPGWENNRKEWLSVSPGGWNSFLSLVKEKF